MIAESNENMYKSNFWNGSTKEISTVLAQATGLVANMEQH